MSHSEVRKDQRMCSENKKHSPDFLLKSFEKCYIFFEFADELVSENGHLLKAENMASSHVIRLFTIQTPIPRRCSYSLEAKFSSISDADHFDFA